MLAPGYDNDPNFGLAWQFCEPVPFQLKNGNTRITRAGWLALLLICRAKTKAYDQQLTDIATALLRLKRAEADYRFSGRTGSTYTESIEPVKDPRGWLETYVKSLQSPVSHTEFSEARDWTKDTVFTRSWLQRAQAERRGIADIAVSVYASEESDEEQDVALWATLKDLFDRELIRLTSAQTEAAVLVPRYSNSKQTDLVMAAIVYSESAYGNTLTLDFSIVVHPAYRRLGLARRLIAKLTDQAKRTMLDQEMEVCLCAHVVNSHMVPLLTSLGFKPANGDYVLEVK